MRPGMELDEVVHEKVMDQCVHVVRAGHGHDEHSAFPTMICERCGKAFNDRIYRDGEVLVPPYSTDIAWAWKVMERAFDHGESFHMFRDLDGQYVVSPEKWNVLAKDGQAGLWDETAFRSAYKCPTAPHAICIAAVYFYLEDGGAEWEWEPPEMKMLREAVEKNEAEYGGKVIRRRKAPEAG